MAISEVLDRNMSFLSSARPLWRRVFASRVAVLEQRRRVRAAALMCLIQATWIAKMTDVP
jgi:hypothetical protein